MSFSGPELQNQLALDFITLARLIEESKEEQDLLSLLEIADLSERYSSSTRAAGLLYEYMCMDKLFMAAKPTIVLRSELGMNEHK